MPGGPPAGQGTQERFSKAADHYDSHARVQRAAAQGLWAWGQGLLPASYQPKATLDIGCGTGFMSSLLLEQWPEAPLHAIDIAPGMLEVVRERLGGRPVTTHLMDGETLSVEHLWLPSDSLLVSGMCAQWFKSLEEALRKWLSVSNTVLFSLLLDGSFEAWLQAHEETRQQPGLRELPTAMQVKSLLHTLQDEGLCFEARFKEHQFLDHHPDGLSFARSLRAIGADQPRPSHRPVNLRRVIEAVGPACTMNYQVAYCYLRRA
ncbi:MAG: methyltransferase domain-containing protein [Limnobacter sp.]|nr:methyltransferase domain-containing protein [Limnobacter sp.]